MHGTSCAGGAGEVSAWLTSKNLSDPVHLHGAHTSGIATVGEDELVVHDCLHPFPEKAARGMDRHRLVADDGLVAPIWEEACSVRRESLEEAFQYRLGHFRSQGVRRRS